jgi:hypothetical protein
LSCVDNSRYQWITGSEAFLLFVRFFTEQGP